MTCDHDGESVYTEEHHHVMPGISIALRDVSHVPEEVRGVDFFSLQVYSSGCSCRVHTLPVVGLLRYAGTSPGQGSLLQPVVQAGPAQFYATTLRATK